MTANSPPYALQASSHSAQLFRQAISTLLGSAGGIVDAGDYLVTQNGAPNMSVNVAGGVPGGRIWVPGTTSAGVQGLYYCFNDATVNVPIAASNPTNPRIDIVVAQVQDAAYAGAVNSFQIAAVTGTPAGSPVAPSTPASSFKLANIAVAALVTSIVTANITDTRTTVSMSPQTLAQTATAVKADWEYSYTDYKTLQLRFGQGGSLASGNSYVLPMQVESSVIAVVGNAACHAASALYFEPADLFAGARGVRLRLRAEVFANAVAPATTFTYGMYPIATIGGASGQVPTIGTIGGLTGSSVSIATPGANSLTQAAGADFNAPGSGFFVLVVTSSAALTAPNSVTEHKVELQARQT